jgi:GNAT superfamily N-acetyltransferase
VNEPTFESLTAAALTGDAAWWRIYRESISLEGREPDEVIRRGVDLGVAVVASARLNGETVGIASAHLLRKPAVVFLVYLATQSEVRGQGCGAKLFEFAWQTASEHPAWDGESPRGIIWEVDSPDIAGSQEEARLGERRIRFFERLGGAVLPAAYTQPPVSGTPVPMLLMFRPAAGEALPNPEETRAIVEAMYAEKYGAVNGIARPVLDELLRGGAAPS